MALCTKVHFISTINMEMDMKLTGIVIFTNHHVKLFLEITSCTPVSWLYLFKTKLMATLNTVETSCRLLIGDFSELIHCN